MRATAICGLSDLIKKELMHPFGYDRDDARTSKNERKKPTNN